MEMKQLKAVCFDLDDTLLMKVYSVLFLCIINGHEAEAREVERRELAGEFDYVMADHLRAAYAKGLPVERLGQEFDRVLTPIKQIVPVVRQLHDQGVRCILITAGPRQVAELCSERWGMDHFDGSPYEVEDGCFTGKIARHIGSQGKVAILKEYLEREGIPPQACAAVGDGISDLPLFAYCGNSIALNYAPCVEGKARHYLRTDDLTDILPLLRR